MKFPSRPRRHRNDQVLQKDPPINVITQNTNSYGFEFEHRIISWRGEILYQRRHTCTWASNEINTLCDIQFTATWVCSSSGPANWFLNQKCFIPKDFNNCLDSRAYSSGKQPLEWNWRRGHYKAQSPHITGIAKNNEKTTNCIIIAIIESNYTKSLINNVLSW